MEFAAGALMSVAKGVGGAFGIGGKAAPMAINAIGAAKQGGGLLATLAKSAPVWGSILSGGATVLSLMAQRQANTSLMVGAEMDALNLEGQAEDTRLDIGQEEVAGANRRNSIRRALLETIGDRDAAYAASGVDLSFGTPAVAREQAAASAERALGQDRDTQEINVSRLEQRAANLRSRAAFTRRAAQRTAGVNNLSMAAQILRRG
jgi:hypothetical protein